MHTNSDLPAYAMNLERKHLQRPTRTFTSKFLSPLQRARRVSEERGFQDEGVTSSLLVECNYCHHEGRSPDEIRAGRPERQPFRDSSRAGDSPGRTAARAGRGVRRARAIGGLHDGLGL